jgi:hypothetical protein
MILGMKSAISEKAVPYSRKINAHFTIPENKTSTMPLSFMGHGVNSKAELWYHSM